MSGQTTGTVRGTISDQQKSVVAGATLDLINTETNVVLAQTSGLGTYDFEFVQPGKYYLKVSSPGFKTAMIENIVVEASKNTTLNVQLTVGQISEKVEVAGTTAGIETMSAQVATNVSMQYIQELPSYTRNVFTLATIEPGVSVGTGNLAGGSQHLDINGTAANVNGNRERRNNWFLDGMDNAGGYRNEPLQYPNPDVVLEMQVSTANTSAEYGRQVGGTFNVITRSGSNEFHGDGFYFFRNKELNANSWANNFVGNPRQDQSQKTAGAVIGGPIRKNKTFFFASFDVFRDNAPGLVNSHEGPTAAILAGDFSGVPHPIYDPSTKLPFPGNRIPANQIDPVGRNLAKLLPTVNNFGDLFVWSYSDTYANQTAYGKLDQHWTDAHTTTFTYMRSWGNEIVPETNNASLNNLPAWGPETNQSHQNLIQANHVWILRPNLLGEFRIGYTRLWTDRDNFGYTHSGDSLAFLGAQNTTIPQADATLYWPAITVGGGAFGLAGARGGLGIFEQPNFRYGGKMSWIKSKHTVKFGADAIMQAERFGNFGAASMTFDGRFTSLSTQLNDVGYGLADLLLGRTSSFGESGTHDLTIHNWNAFYFVQDEWKILPRLTLTPGLRYEFYLPVTADDNRQSGYVAGYKSTLFPNAPAGVAFAGDPGIPNGFYHSEWSLFAPRLGLAWDVKGNGRTALRAGVGKYYSATPLQSAEWLSDNAPWTPSASCANTIASNPWLSCESPVFTRVPTPWTASSAKDYQWPPTVGLNGADPNFKTAFSYQFNALLERELRKGFKVRAGYVGNRTFRLLESVPANFAVWATGASINSANILSRRPVQGFGQINMIESGAKSIYNAFQTVADIRTGARLTFRINYAFGRGFSDVQEDPGASAPFNNPSNPRGDWGETQAHHVLNFFYIWHIPFLEHDHRLRGRLLGGWSFSGNGTIKSGSPSNVIIGSDWNYDGVAGDRPDKAGPIQYVLKDLGNGYFRYIDAGNTATNSIQRGPFALPGNGVNHNTFGNLPRNAVFGPGSWNVDSGLLKDFHLSEVMYLQLRLEAFNIFNHPNLNGPDLNYNDPTFGQIFGKAGARLTQIGLKFYF